MRFAPLVVVAGLACTRAPAHPCRSDAECAIGWSCVAELCQPSGGPVRDASPPGVDGHDASDSLDSGRAEAAHDAVASSDAGPDEAFDARPDDVAIRTGTDGSPAAGLSSMVSSHEFGHLEVGVASGTFLWPITNAGAATTGVLRIDNADPAEVTVDNPCLTNLSAGDVCSLAVTFKPAAGGPRTASLAVSATPGGSITLTMTAAGQYRLTVTTTGNGTVTSSPAGIDCGASCSTLVDPGPVTLLARTTNGSGSVFSGWSVSDCPGPFRDCVVDLTAPLTVSAHFAPMTANLIFVTAATFPANLGSATSYDAKCNQAATAAGINDATGTAFIATTSDHASLMKDRLGTARGWVRMDGLPFADSQSSLFVAGQVFNSIRFDETGARLHEVVYFTGADAGASLGFLNCSDWTTNVDGTTTATTAMYGASDAGPGYWLFAFDSSCNMNSALACMGKTRAVAVAPVITPGKRIWQTSPYTVGMQSPDAKCLADRPTGVTAGIAFVATTNRTPASVLTPSAVYVRPDGTRVGTGAQLAAGDSLDSGIWQDFAGVYSAQSIYTGAPGPNIFGIPETTCANWTTQGTTGMFAPSSFDSSTIWSGGYLIPCPTLPSYPLYCVEP